MSRTRLFVGSLLAALCFAREASGQTLVPNPSLGGPKPATLVSIERLPPTDYDLPNPDREPLDYARAVANAGFVNWTLWQISWFRAADWTPVDRRSLWDNLEHGFAFDQDPLQTNFLGHPYHGGLLFNSARGAGLSFWESVPYALGGSLLWELFAEREPPSANDMAVTGLGGIMLGEIAYRLSSGILDDSSSGSERLWRELAAFAVNPMRGLNRAYTGTAWKSGPPPRRQRIELEFHAGLNRTHVTDHDLSTSFDSSLLLGARAEYGDLLPRARQRSIRPFEYFDIHGAVNLLDREVSGATVYAEALVYGISFDLTDDVGPYRDNAVLGFDMTYDYQGTNIATYGGVALGPTGYVVFRYGRKHVLRLGIGAEIVPVFGARSALRATDERTYNFASGLAGWGRLELDLGPLELGVRSRHYLTRVIDGSEGNEFVGATRCWGELHVLDGLGIGFAPAAVTWQSIYADQPNRSGYQLEYSGYLVLTR